ncbi:hypothetical protein F5Y16DRAFT_423415 [Xylariaceae sp. FL0255]|nr:hypothetical protein F5Y16DRAFT_423415 [Xylariaceae sp. FL0255]
MKGFQLLLLKLPNELLFQISDHLPISDTVALALTCKRLFNMFRVEVASIQKDLSQKRILLERLEKDIPGLVYCPFLFELRDFKPTNAKGNYLIHREKVRGVVFNRDRGRRRGWILSWEAIRLARNYRLYGPEHGIPLSCLFQETSKTEMLSNYETYEALWKVTAESSKQELKWVGEDLYLSYTQVVHFDMIKRMRKASTKLFEDSEETYCLEIGAACNHHSLEENNEFEFWREYAAERDRASMWSVKAEEFTKSCTICETDRTGWIRHKDESDGFIVTYKTYHNLGDCSPSGPGWVKWRLLTNGPFGAWTLGHISRESANGEVKKRWMLATDESPQSQSEETFEGVVPSKL